MIPISQIDPELSIYKENTVVIWGAGFFGKELLRLFRHFKIEVTCVCDSNEDLWSKTLEGVSIVSPKEVETLQKEKAGNLFVQLAMSSPYEVEVQPLLEEMGIETVCSCKEAYEMLTYYKICETIQKNKKFLDFRVQVRAKDVAVNDEWFYRYLIQHYENLGIIICMCGKTGDTTMVKTFKEHNIPWAQSHHSNLLTKEVLQEQKVKIITAVRDPIARDFSQTYECFTNISTFPLPNKCYLESSNDAEMVFHKTWANSTLSRNMGEVERWFSEFAENAVCLLDHPFDKEAGYSIIQEGNYDIFVYQLEKLNDIIPQLSDWVGVPFTKLENSNVAADKWIGKSYKQAQKEMKFSQEYFDICYNDPYVKHFYSEADIETFKERWRGNIDPTK